MKHSFYTLGVICTAIALFSPLAGKDPVYRWSFEKVRLNAWNSFGKSSFHSNAVIKDGVLFPAQVSKGKVALSQLRLSKLGAPKATFVIRFSPDSAVSRQMSLFTYAEQSWGRGLFGIYITKDSKIRIVFNHTMQKPAVKYTATSSRQDLKQGAKYTLQVTLDNGTLLVWLNGKQILERKNTPSLASFTMAPGKYYPMAVIGSTFERNISEQHFQGSVTSVEYYDSVPEIPESSKNPSCMMIPKVSQTPVIDGKTDETFYKSMVWSTPFHVLGQESSLVNGLWENADSKFTENAARAVIFCDEKYVYGTFKAFFPEDTPPNNSDAVEFFLQPGSGTIRQVIVYAGGNSECYTYKNETSAPALWSGHGIKTAVAREKNCFSVEIAIPLASIGISQLPAPGTAWKGNFARSGRSCGGLSTWAPVGSNFFTPSLFGLFFHGSVKDYLQKEIRSIVSEFSSIQDVKKKAGQMLEKIRQKNEIGIAELEKWGNDLERLRRLAVKKHNQGKKMLVWRHDPWSDFGPDLRIPITPELKKISLFVPKGARAVSSFIVSNLTSEYNMFSVKLAVNKKLMETVRFREGGFIRAGKRIYPDAIFDLPLGSVVRQAPESSTLLWLDIDTRALAPGRYVSNIVLIPAYPGFKKRSILLELEVSPVDISKSPLPVWAYPLRYPRHLELLKDYGFNTSCLLPSHFIPEPGKDGKVSYDFVDTVIKTFRKQGLTEKDIYFMPYMELSRKSKIKLPNGKTALFGSPEWKTEYGSRLKKFRDYLKDKYAIGYSQCIFYTNDEPFGDPSDPKSTASVAFEGAAFLKSVDKNFITFCNPWRIGEGGYDAAYIKRFDIIVPNLPRMREKPAAMELYKKNPQKVWSYSVLQKLVPATVYRRISWQNMECGFHGIATFYDLFDVSGDQFFSDDPSPRNRKVTSDYATVYSNDQSLWTNPAGVQFAISRRMEAWYLGIIDFKVAEYCRNRINALKKQGINTVHFEKELNGIAKSGAIPDGNMDEAAVKLLRLAEKLCK